MKHTEKSLDDARICHVSLDVDTSIIVDNWRRQQDIIPPRRDAVRELVRRGANAEASA